MSDDEHSEPEALLAPIDGEPGPMPALAPERAEAITGLIVARWSNSLAGMEPADADAGPAVPLPAARAQRLVHTVTRRYADMQPARTARAVLVAGAALSVAGLAFGALHLWDRPPTAAGPVHAAPIPMRSATPQSSSAHGLQRVSEHAGAPTAPPAPAVALPPVSQSNAPSGSVSIHLPPSAAKPVLRDDASLERANAMRAVRDWPAAQQLYLQIADGGTRPRERYVASVAAAALSLQHTNQPRRALELYRRALRWFPSGDLSEEARLGVARALAALHDPEHEADALREFLGHHPDSADAPRAQQRLKELSAALAPAY